MSWKEITLDRKFGERVKELFALKATPSSMGELSELVSSSYEDFFSSEKGKEILTGKKSVSIEAPTKTRHPITFEDGIKRYTGCAGDSLVIGTILGMNSLDETSCPHCDEPIKVSYKNSRIEYVQPKDVVFWFGVSREGKGSGDLTSYGEHTCPYINFFSSEEHVNEWKRANPRELGVMLTLPQAIDMLRATFEPLGKYFSTMKFEPQTRR